MRATAERSPNAGLPSHHKSAQSGKRVKIIQRVDIIVQCDFDLVDGFGSRCGHGILLLEYRTLALAGSAREIHLASGNINVAPLRYS